MFVGEKRVFYATKARIAFLLLIRFFVITDSCVRTRSLPTISNLTGSAYFTVYDEN